MGVAIHLQQLRVSSSGAHQRGRPLENQGPSALVFVCQIFIRHALINGQIIFELDLGSEVQIAVPPLAELSVDETDKTLSWTLTLRRKADRRWPDGLVRRIRDLALLADLVINSRSLFRSHRHPPFCSDGLSISHPHTTSVTPFLFLLFFFHRFLG